MTTARSPALMPLRIFIAVLALVFITEYAVMTFITSLSPPRPEADRLNFLDSVFLTTLLAPALWWLIVRPLQKLFEARGRVLGQLFQAQEEERARIARDLHDELGQQLTAVMLALRGAQDASTVDAARKHAGDAARVAADALESIRAISRGLRPATLEDLGLGPAVERLCDDFRTVHDLDVRLTISIPQARRFPTAVETCAYRLLQEAVTNAARHAQARSVSVELHDGGSALTLLVADDGRGFVPGAAPDSSSGLQGMRERVAMLDGQLAVDTSPGKGTRVSASIPVPPQTAQDRRGTER